MKRPDTGGPAFPRAGFWPDTSGVDREDLHAAIATKTEPEDGMTVRDYFAGQAIMGVLANSDLPDLFKKGFAPSKAAEVAFMVADAMIAQRNGGGS